ncbi:glucan endo-1,3-beta-glucosidase-like [Aegilops tauschii subsp. strangulata]|uniref:glucan endo-1,3-beta-glucosidase-like n=1 Tax=Aegilops tauschii subsp. strangulata TaxID=200361 RepID=UPI00098B80DF|nr:glucan endo-1,3-beta-glucosidase-like [Aegilops tauschii subsp. strangulata]
MATPRRHGCMLCAEVVMCIFLVIAPLSTAIGVNYGTKGDNLPSPAKVAAFLVTRTNIDRVKLFDTNPDIVRAFAGTGISVMVTAGNGDIPGLATQTGADSWVATNIAPYYPATDISLVAVGNEIMDTADKNLIGNLVPAMQTLKAALVTAGYGKIRVSTPSSLGILVDAQPPSAARFRDVWDVAIFTPMLQFLRKTKSPLIVNTYPYFGYNGDTLPYALARPNPGVLDTGTGITYTSMLEAQLDSVYSAMKKLGFEDVEILVGETGWPTKAMDGQIGVSPAEAAEYNKYLIGEVSSGSGTPLMPKRKFETYIFALFNEDLKPGPVAERNFGMFQPDFTPMYDIGIMKDPVKTAPPMAATAHALEAAGPTEANGSNSAKASAPAGNKSSTNDRTPEEVEGLDTPSSAKGEPSELDSSEAAAKGGDGEEENSEKTKPKEESATPPAAGAASEATNFLFPIPCILAVALCLTVHV